MTQPRLKTSKLTYSAVIFERKHGIFVSWKRFEETRRTKLELKENISLVLPHVIGKIRVFNNIKLNCVNNSYN